MMIEEFECPICGADCDFILGGTTGWRIMCENCGDVTGPYYDALDLTLYDLDDGYEHLQGRKDE
jgi:uncharacterized Zn finger protein